MEFEIQASGALNMRPAAFKHLVGKNISSAENDTGRAARDIVKRPIPDGASGIVKATRFECATIAKLDFKVENKHPLIEYVEEKTKPHEIVPKNKKALAFTVKGQHVITRKVKHPGTTGKHSF